MNKQNNKALSKSQQHPFLIILNVILSITYEKNVTFQYKYLQDNVCNLNMYFNHLVQRLECIILFYQDLLNAYIGYLLVLNTIGRCVMRLQCQHYWSMLSVRTSRRHFLLNIESTLYCNVCFKGMVHGMFYNQAMLIDQYIPFHYYFNIMYSLVMVTQYSYASIF